MAHLQTIIPTRHRRSRAVLNAARRKQLEDALHQIVELLDALDGDPDFEPYMAGTPANEDEREPSSDFEPSLGATQDANQLRAWRGRPLGVRFMSAVEDGEEGDDTGIGDAMGLNSDDEPDTDKEPSLGWTDDGFCGDDKDREPNGDEGDYSDCVDEPWFPYKAVRDRPAALDTLRQLQRLGRGKDVKETPHAFYHAGRMYPVGV